MSKLILNIYQFTSGRSKFRLNATESNFIFSCESRDTFTQHQQMYSISKCILSAYLSTLPHKPQILSFICE